MPNLDHRTIKEAAQRLDAGELVAFPTETVYGLGADAMNPDAVQRVFQLKGRPANNPMIVHVADEQMACRVVAHWPERASELSAQFWPGPLTLVLEKTDALPDIVTAGQPSVGVRCPDHPIALALIKALGRPIVGPGANPSGRISPTSAQHVRDGFPESDLTILNGGQCRTGIESTVLSLIHQPPRILRPGAVSREQLGQDIQPHTPHTTEHPVPAPLSPGQFPSHYAPAARAQLFDPNQCPHILDSAPQHTAVLTHDPSRIAPSKALLIRLPADPAPYAAALYAALREADALNPPLILIERPQRHDGLWAAIQDRLQRATAHPNT